MANLQFYPLYFVYNNRWAFRTWEHHWYWGWSSTTYNHRGHCHFFMMGHDFESQQAYTGEQTYNFSLDDEWSPRTDDPNQQQNLRIVGTPKWYFYVEEFWRRIYIQQWEENINSTIDDDTIVGKQGVKYDACYDMHRNGPFREGKNNFFYWNESPRTLPVDYWHQDEKYTRDHYLRPDPSGLHFWDTRDENIDENATRMIPDEYYVGRPDDHGDGDPRFNPERNFGWPDLEYMYPTIEYQKVTHLNWERPPGWQTRDIDDENFGDGFEFNVNLPFKDAGGEVQSPFSDANGDVQTPGTYCHGFEASHPDSVLKYPDVDEAGPGGFSGGENVTYSSSMYNIPTELKGQKVTWNIPDHLQGLEDGMWVEQCLGGIVKGKALVTVEDNFGGRSEVWVTDQQFMVRQDFAGSDQNEPV